MFLDKFEGIIFVQLGRIVLLMLSRVAWTIHVLSQRARMDADRLQFQMVGRMRHVWLLVRVMEQEFVLERLH